MVDFVTQIFSLFSKRPRFFFSSLILICFLFAYLASHIKLNEDISSFMPKSKETEIINFVYTNNQLSDKIIFKIDLKQKTTEDEVEVLKMYIDMFVEELNNKVGDFTKEIMYQMDDDNIGEVQNCIQSNLPYYLSETDYSKLDTLISPENILQTLENNKQILLMPSAGMMKKNILTDPFHLSIPTLQKLQNLGEFQSFKTDDGYFFSADLSSIFLFIVAKNSITETKENSVFVEKLVQCVNYLDSISNNTLNITYFGAIPVSVSNAQQVKTDSWVSLSIAISLIIIVLLLYFRKTYAIVLILVPVFFGALFAFACIVLFKGSISGIAIGASAAIFGIAVNYSLYFLVHYKNEKNPVHALKNIAFPMTVGSITTVGAFLSLLFVKSEALKDFGLFSSLTLVGTLLFVLFLLPQFFRKKSEQNEETEKKITIWEKIANIKFENIPYIWLVILVLTCVFAHFSKNVKFETDFSKLGYMTKEQKIAMEEMSVVANINVPYLYHVSYGKNLEEALQNYEISKPIMDSLSALGYFNRIQGIGDLLPSVETQKYRAEKWTQFWNDKKENTLLSFENSCENLGLNFSSFDNFYQLLDRNFKTDSSDFSIIKKLLLSDYLIETPERSAIITLLYPSEDIEQILNSPLAQIKNTIMFNRNMSNKSMIELLYSDFSFVLWFCAILVFVFLLASFGRIELTLLTILPMVLGWFWILGLMVIFDIQFNIVNIILATFIFGLGDDYAINMLEGLMNDYTHKKRLSVSYKVAVILSSVILFIGLGALIVSKHPAMRSLAQVSMIGMICVVLMSYTILPIIFKWLTQKKGKPRLQPVTLIRFLKTFYSFSVFVLGCIVLNLILPFFLIPFLPLVKRKYYYHCLYSWVSRFVSYRIPSVKFVVEGFTPEKFEKPAIIVANHQAHIDLTCIIGLHPKIIVLTNKWVWNSPFFAFPMRFADFFPIMFDLENNIDKLKKLTQKGYSILIFPEGTRSPDCKIQRFHKGAFYLAEQLKLDILPITIHGMGHVLPKKEMMLRKGKITLNIGERVSYDYYSNIGSYQEVCKWFRKKITDTYNQLASEIETSDYWIEKVFHNYVYKGINVEWKVKQNLRKHNNYIHIIEEIKNYKKIKILNCGYGEFPLLVSLTLPNMDIYAFENDKDMFSLAKNCVSVPSNLHYVDDFETFGIECDYEIDMNKLDVK